MKFVEFKNSDYKIHDRKHLDKYLVELCAKIVEGQRKDPEKYGMVAACVLDNDHNIVASTSTKEAGKWKHAERNAIEKYQSKYGEIPEGSIIITTLSPCDGPMADRYEGSCTDLINNSIVKKVYCGYMDPSQHEEDFEFTVEDTANKDIQKLCKKFADTFLGGKDHPLNEDAMMGKIEATGKIVRILKKQHSVPFSDKKNWLLIDTDPAKGNQGIGIKWIPAETRFEWVRPYRETVSERQQELTNKKLVIFDIDDTLVTTKTRVGVVRDGNTIKQLDSHEFTLYQKQPGETFDFGAFRNAKDFFQHAHPIAPMIDQLKHDIATGNKVVMVTARSDFDSKEIFLKTFEQWHVDMNKVHVYRAGNDTDPVPIDEKKARIIHRLLNGGNYTKAIMYDDSKPNLESFLQLRQEYPSVRFYAWHVDHSGNTRELARAVEENFADGKHPGRKGLAKRSGVNTKASVSSLRNTAKHSTGEKQRISHWLANMKAGKAKKK
jgi:pyrimidine deaminase RibD-like protein